MTDKLPNPGSDEALEQGCLCPVLDNNYGRGASNNEAGGHSDIFWINADCPIHGQKEE